MAIALIQGAEPWSVALTEIMAQTRSSNASRPGSLQAAPQQTGASGPRATDLLERWAKEAVSAQSTLDLWRTYVEIFTRFMGREDASSFQRPDIVRWKLHLIKLGNSPKTMNDGKLAALKAIFRWGVDNELLKANPASGVSIRRGEGGRVAAGVREGRGCNDPRSRSTGNQAALPRCACLPQRVSDMGKGSTHKRRRSLFYAGAAGTHSPSAPNRLQPSFCKLS